jgi:cyclophilin family peptidyl-prolyl cis-trans isomerase
VIPPEAEPRQVKTYEAEPEMTIDPAKQYTAVIRTEKGLIRIELFPDEAPRTVNNFVFLAREGFYDGLTFYFVRPGLVAQTGNPTCTDDPGVTCVGEYGPGYTLSAETNEEEHVAGTVAMAEDTRTGDIHGSQFFIALRDVPELDGRNIVFGRVVEGMDVVESLTPREWDDPSAPPGDKILSVTIEET